MKIGDKVTPNWDVFSNYGSQGIVVKMFENYAVVKFGSDWVYHNLDEICLIKSMPCELEVTIMEDVP